MDFVSFTTISLEATIESSTEALCSDACARLLTYLLVTIDDATSLWCLMPIG